jgi:tetratricopeptide (TPR) repeat protein
VKYLSSVLVAAVVILGSQLAFAEEPQTDEGLELEDEEVSAEDVERAQKYFDLGAQLYFEGEFSRAAVEFRRAHEIYPHPIFLFNIALIQRRLNQPRDALAIARQAQAMDQDLPPEQDAQNQGMIDGIGAALLGHEIAGKLAGQAVEDLPQPPAGTESEPLLSTLGWVGVGMLALGVAGLTGGGVVQARLGANREVYDLRQPLYPESQAMAQLEETMERQQTQRTALFASGAGLTAVGAALLVVALLPDDSESDLAFSFSVTEPGFFLIYQW